MMVFNVKTKEDPGNIVLSVFIIGLILVCGGIFGCNKKLTPIFVKEHSILQYTVQIISFIIVGCGFAGLSYAIVDSDVNPYYSGIAAFVVCGMLLLQAYLWKDEPVPNSIYAKHAYCLFVAVYFLLLPGMIILAYTHNQSLLREAYRDITVNTTSAYVEFNANFDCYNWDQLEQQQEEGEEEEKERKKSSLSTSSRAKACSGYRAKLHVLWDNVQCPEFSSSSQKLKCSTWLWDEDCIILTNKQTVNQNDFIQNIKKVEDCIEERYGTKFATTTTTTSSNSNNNNIKGGGDGIVVVQRVPNFISTTQINVLSSCDETCLVEPQGGTMKDDDEILDMQNLVGFIMFFVGAACVTAIGINRTYIEYKMSKKEDDSSSTSDDDDEDNDSSYYDDDSESLSSSSSTAMDNGGIEQQEQEENIGSSNSSRGDDNLDDDIEIGRDNTTTSAIIIPDDDSDDDEVVVVVGNDSLSSSSSSSVERIDSQQKEEERQEDSQGSTSSSCCSSLVNEDSSSSEFSIKDDEEEEDDALQARAVVLDEEVSSVQQLLITERSLSTTTKEESSSSDDGSVELDNNARAREIDR